MRDTSKLIALGRSAPVVKNEIRVYSPDGEGLLWFNVNDLALHPPCLSPANATDMLVGFGEYNSIWVDDGRAAGCIK
jgi:hypothetical protein